MILDKRLICGNWEEGQSGYFTPYDPSTEKKPKDYQVVGIDQIDNAFGSATSAYPIYNDIDSGKRSAFVNDTANEI
ncbi:hypothetical protein K8352_15830 [Flavobacteriaceae bacterium F89]|uniref:Uncharacterized protein n=1 Tax=Cerina litoralis TaxID=2874477 RepID=A0AAE3EW67_9FLAO|nr:hypothetical protein [Cerina litoralis]MCG2462230.1 hypothetical protein [Cerina litoralis]